jgi:hypothetical protein
VSGDRPPSSLTGIDRPRPRDSVATEILDGEAVLHREGTRALHVLNRTATVIWQNLDGEITLDELSALLSEAANEPLDMVQRDVLRTVQSFGASGLLHAVEGTDSEEGEGDRAHGENVTVSGNDLRFLAEPPYG